MWTTNDNLQPMLGMERSAYGRVFGYALASRAYFTIYWFETQPDVYFPSTSLFHSRVSRGDFLHLGIFAMKKLRALDGSDDYEPNGHPQSRWKWVLVQANEGKDTTHEQRRHTLEMLIGSCPRRGDRLIPFHIPDIFDRTPPNKEDWPPADKLFPDKTVARLMKHLVSKNTPLDVTLYERHPAATVRFFSRPFSQYAKSQYGCDDAVKIENSCHINSSLQSGTADGSEGGTQDTPASINSRDGGSDFTAPSQTSTVVSISTTETNDRKRRAPDQLQNPIHIPNPKRTPAKLISSGPPTEPCPLEGGWPDGWTRQVFQRTNGDSQGQRDKYWISPEGEKFRSLMAIKRAQDPSYWTTQLD